MSLHTSKWLFHTILFVWLTYISAASIVRSLDDSHITDITQRWVQPELRYKERLNRARMRVHQTRVKNNVDMLSSEEGSMVTRDREPDEDYENERSSARTKLLKIIASEAAAKQHRLQLQSATDNESSAANFAIRVLIQILRDTHQKQDYMFRQALAD